MVLKVFDQFHNFASHLSALEDVSIESVLESGDKTLSFTVYGDVDLKNEYYIQTETDEFIVKEIRPYDEGTEVVCVLNLEDLESKPHMQFTAQNRTALEAARLAVSGTGWIVRSDMTKTRSVQTFKATPLQLIYKIRDAFMCDVVFDSLNKTVTFTEELGEDRGAYLISGLNLKKLNPTYDSYDYYTRILPIGKDDLKITSVNPTGKDYLENYQYSNKPRTLVWEDTSYEDASKLMEDAEGKLADLSKPKISYSADVIDLAKQKAEYSILSYGLGDKIKIIDDRTGVSDKQRIVKIVEHPLNPDDNTCEISNTTLTWEELQAKLKAAADAWEEVTNTDGSINGIYVHAVPADNVDGVEIVVEEGIRTSETIGGMNEQMISIGKVTSGVASALGMYEKEDGTYAYQELEAIKGRFGDIETTYLQTAEADINYAKIDFANVDEVNAGKIMAKSGIIKDVTSETGTVTKELIGVKIKGDLVEANTIVADRIVFSGDDGLFYELNKNGETVEAKQTDKNSLNGSILVAKSVTADKVSVSDLTAFGANIAGIILDDDAMHSFGKNSADSASAGFYFDRSGNAGIGSPYRHIEFVDGNLEILTDEYRVSKDANQKTHVEIGELDTGKYIDIGGAGLELHDGKSKTLASFSADEIKLLSEKLYISVFNDISSILTTTSEIDMSCSKIIGNKQYRAEYSGSARKRGDENVATSEISASSSTKNKYAYIDVLAYDNYTRSVISSDYIDLYGDVSIDGTLNATIGSWEDGYYFSIDTGVIDPVGSWCQCKVNDALKICDFNFGFKVKEAISASDSNKVKLFSGLPIPVGQAVVWFMGRNVQGGTQYMGHVGANGYLYTIDSMPKDMYCYGHITYAYL